MKKNIVNDLNDLFELFKSGALNNDEYNLLKAEIIQQTNFSSNDKNEPEKEKKLPPIQKVETELPKDDLPDEGISETKPPEIIENDESQKNPNIKDDEKVLITNSSLTTKKRVLKIVGFTSLFIIIGLAIIFFLMKSNDSTSISNSNNEVLSDESYKVKQEVKKEVAEIHNSEIETPVVSTVNNNGNKDSIAIANILMEELKNFVVTLDYGIEWYHEIVKLKKLNGATKELTIVVTFSNYDYNTCKACSGLLSIFEVEEKNGWKILKKELGFYSEADNGDLPDNIIIKEISPNDYNLIIEDSFSTQGSYSDWVYAYAFKENSLEKISSTQTGGYIN